MIVTQWFINVNVDASDVTQYIIGTVNINAQIETARTASFTVGLDAGIFSANPIKDIGKSVTIDVSGTRYFTGVIRNASVNLDSRTVQYNCSDEYNDRLDLQAESFYNGNPSIKYSKHVFGDVDQQDPLSLYESYLAQIDKQYTLDASGNEQLTPILSVSAPVSKVFTESDVLIQGSSISYQNASVTSFKDDPYSTGNDFSKTPQESTEVKTVVGADTKPLNEIIYEVHHRFPVLHQVNIQYTMNSTAEITNQERGLLSGVTVPSRAMLEQAISKTGWHLKDSITYGDLPPSQTYTIGGNPSVWIRTADAQTRLFTSASFILSYRWITYCTEIDTKIVRCTESISKYGLNSERRTVAIDGMNTYINLDDWKSFKANVGQDLSAFGYSKMYVRSEDKFDPTFNTALHTNRDYLAVSDSKYAKNQASEILENIADSEVKKEIVGKSGSRVGVNTTSLTFKVPFTSLPSANVGYRAEYQTRFWLATGLVSSIDFNFSNDGSALADVTITSVTDTAQRNVDVGVYSSGSPNSYSENGFNFSTVKLVPDGNGGFNEVQTNDTPSKTAANNPETLDSLGSTSYKLNNGSDLVVSTGFSIPTFIRGIDTWSVVGVAATNIQDDLPMGYYADHTVINDGYIGNNSTANTEADLPANLLIVTVPELPNVHENNNETKLGNTSVKIIDYIKDTIQPGTGE